MFSTLLNACMQVLLAINFGMNSVSLPGPCALYFVNCPITLGPSAFPLFSLFLSPQPAPSFAENPILHVSTLSAIHTPLPSPGLVWEDWKASAGPARVVTVEEELERQERRRAIMKAFQERDIEKLPIEGIVTLGEDGDVNIPNVVPAREIPVFIPTPDRNVLGKSRPKLAPEELNDQRANILNTVTALAVIEPKVRLLSNGRTMSLILSMWDQIVLVINTVLRPFRWPLGILSLSALLTGSLVVVFSLARALLHTFSSPEKGTSVDLSVAKQQLCFTRTVQESTGKIF